MRPIVRKGEFYPRLVEGVADKYAEREFHIPDENSEFEKKPSDQNKKSEIIYKYKKGEKTRFNSHGIRTSVFIIKNPANLDGVHIVSRGIIDSDGNLYVINDASLTHTEILDKLNELGLVKYVDRWWKKVPSDFVTVQRVLKKNAFHIGDSNDIVNPEVEKKTRVEWKMPPIREAKKLFIPFFEKAKQKNPQYQFYTKTFREIYR